MLERKEAMALLLEKIGAAPIIHCNGYISRESFSLSDRSQSFFMIGSMGMASSIGHGVALARPEQKVFVFDGDGNVLMNLGALATIGACAPENFYHVVFDNGAYASTGYQKTLSGRVHLGKVAQAAGYRFVREAETLRSLKETLGAWLQEKGPAFLLLRIDPKSEDNHFGRITYTPNVIAERFMNTFKNGDSFKAH